MRRVLVLLIALTVCHAVTACRRKTTPARESAVSPAAPASPATPAADGTAAPTAAAPAPAAATAIAQSKPGASESNPLNTELTNAVARFRDKHKRLPASWQELVQTGFLKAVPTPPRGLRYAIDPISAMVVEVK